MAYLSSESVYVFPSTKRGHKQVSARLLSEKTLSGIINKLLDTDGFVITKADEFAYENPIQFNIHGYYFHVNNVQAIINALPPTSTLIYANIVLKEEGNYLQLQGQDDETIDPNTSIVTASIYQGLNFTAQAPLQPQADEEVHYILLLKRDSSDGEWYIPPESRYKFTKDSLDIIVDGGEI